MFPFPFLSVLKVMSHGHVTQLKVWFYLMTHCKPIDICCESNFG